MENNEVIERLNAIEKRICEIFKIENVDTLKTANVYPAKIADDVVRKCLRGNYNKDDKNLKYEFPERYLIKAEIYLDFLENHKFGFEEKIELCDRCDGNGYYTNDVLTCYHKGEYRTDKHTCKNCEGLGHIRSVTISMPGPQVMNIPHRFIPYADTIKND